MSDKLKFDENFLEETDKNEKNIMKLRLKRQTGSISDIDFDKIINLLNEDSFSICTEENNSFNKCKTRINKHFFLNINERTNEDSYINEIKKECQNEIIYVYNCLKRFGKFI